MRSRITLTAVAGLAALAGGCAGDETALRSTPAQFGEATRQTLAAQIVDPDPVYDTVVPPTSGDHANQAVERYRTDKIKQPKREVSTSAAGGGGGSGGGSGGGGS